MRPVKLSARFFVGALCFFSVFSQAQAISCKVASAKSQRDKVPKSLREDAFLRAVAKLQKSEASPVPIAKALKAFREETLGFLKSSNMSLETLVSLYESRLRQQSAQLRQQIQDKDFAEYELVIVGGGIHGTVALMTALNRKPDIKVLLIEGSSSIATNFRSAGDGFRINSSNRKSGPGLKPLPGEGNINELPEFPIQLSEITAVKYPSSNELASVAIIAAYSATTSYRNVDVLLEENVESLFQFEDGVIVKTLQTDTLPPIQYQKLAVASGLGKPSFPAAVVKEIESNPRLSEPLADTEVKRISSFSEIMKAINETENPKKIFADKDVVVVGTGDSANVLIEFLLGYAPRRAYGLDSAQIGLPNKILWLGQDQNTCEKYLAKARSRYAQLSTGYRSSSPAKPPILEGIPGRVNSDGREKATRVNSQGRLMTLIEGKAVESDLAVYATGFENSLYSLIPPEFYESLGFEPTQSKDSFEDITEFLLAKTTVSGESPTNVGRILKKQGKDIVFVGPGAGALAKDTELFGIIQNFVSIFNNAPRTQAATRSLLLRYLPEVAVNEPLEAISLEIDKGLESSIVIPWPGKGRRISNLDLENFFREAMLDVLETFTVELQEGQGPKTPQTFQVRIDNQKLRRGVRLSLKGARADLEPIREQLVASTTLLTVIKNLLGTSGVKEIRLTLKHDSDSILSIKSLKIIEE